MIRIVQEYGERKTRWTLEITSGQIPPTCLEAFIADLRKAARTVETLNRSIDLSEGVYCMCCTLASSLD